jgi:4-amino-4-deoxy-L-arabinose transferase-like glycosyltransferase
MGFLLLLCGVLFFSMPGLRSLYETDEARYAEISREMLVTGDWVTPHLNYVKYFEKPPLTYWLVALSFKLFGVSDASARFVPMLFGTLTVLLCFLLGRSLWDARSGLWGGAVLATSLMFLLLSRVLLVDMVLCFGIVLSIYGAWQARQKLKHGVYAFWVGLAAAFLAKGLLGPGLVVLQVIIYCALSREWDLVKRLANPKAMGLCALLSLPWVIWVSLVNPEFFKFFFIDEHLGRLLTDRQQRQEPFWYYLPILPAALFPWVTLFPWGLKRLWPGKANLVKPAHRSWLFVSVWAAWFFLFLSISSSKMIHYILPVLPPLGILMGRSFALLKGWKPETPAPVGLTRGLVALSVAVLAAGAALLLVPAFNPDIKFDHLGALLIVGPMLASALAVIIYLLRKKLFCTVAAPVSVLLILLVITALGAPRLDDYRSVKGLVKPLRPLLTKSDILANYGDYYHGTVFYGQRRVLVADNWGELDFGRRHTPGSSNWFIKKDADFLRFLQSPKQRVFVIAEIGAYKRLDKMAQGVPGLLLFKLKTLGDKVLFSNRPLN